LCGQSKNVFKKQMQAFWFKCKKKPPVARARGGKLFKRGGLRNTKIYAARKIKAVLKNADVNINIF